MREDMIRCRGRIHAAHDREARKAGPHVCGPYKTRKLPLLGWFDFLHDPEWPLAPLPFNIF